MRVLIVDDESLARRRMRTLLAEIDDVDVVGEAADTDAARSAIDEHAPDVVLLDVRMPGESGLALAASLGDDGPAVIFTTAHEEHALAAFDAAAVDYLLKPITVDRLRRALGRVRRDVVAPDVFVDLAARLGGGDPDRIAARQGSTTRFFDPATISAFHAVDGYAAFEVAGEEILVEETITHLEQRLAGRGFVRVHRNGLVNLHRVRGLDREGDGTVVVLDDGRRQPVSRRQLPELKRRLGLG